MRHSIRGSEGVVIESVNLDEEDNVFGTQRGSKLS